MESVNVATAFVTLEGRSTPRLAILSIWIDMAESGSVSRWIDELKNGNDDAARQIWGRYVERLIRIAHSKLIHSPKRMADEEDVVNRAFMAFLEGVELGRFQRLSDRDDLWQILVMLTERQAIDQTRAERAIKRGAHRLNGQASRKNDEYAFSELDNIRDPSPTPSFALQTSEELGILLSRLENEELQGIALAKLEGLTNREIAEKIERAECTVERKLKLIREIWVDRAHIPRAQRPLPRNSQT